MELLMYRKCVICAALINQPLPGDAVTTSENRLVLSHTFNHENMIWGVWDCPDLNCVRLPYARHVCMVFPVSYMQEYPTFCSHSPSGKFKMAGSLSALVGSSQLFQHKHINSPLAPTPNLHLPALLNTASRSTKCLTLCREIKKQQRVIWTTSACSALWKF